MSDAAADAAWKPAANPWLIAIIVTLAAFMEILDTTIVNVSLPHIAGSVSASYDDATWALTSYLVANGIVLPISGFLGRLIGRKRYFMICIAMFTVSSFLCGTSTSLSELIIFRLMQGFFGGGLQPNQQSIILDTFEPAQRGRAFSVVAIAVICAPIIGPTLGGYITDNYSWRWVFFINIPVGIFAFFAVAALVEDPPWVKRVRARVIDFDYIGLGLIALGFASLQIMLDRGEDEDWFSSPLIVTCGILGVAGILGAIYWLLIAKKPIVNIRVFANRNFAVGSVMIFGMGAILYSGTVLIPQLAQQRLGYTATLAGLVLSPGAAMILLMIPAIGRILPLVQTRLVIAFGYFTLGCALYVCPRRHPGCELHDARADARHADPGAGIPVRPHQHDHLFHHAARVERGCEFAVCHAPQRGRVDRHCAVDRGHYGADANPPILPRAKPERVQSELYAIAGPYVPNAAGHGPFGRAGGAAGVRPGLPAIDVAIGDFGVSGRVCLLRHRRVLHRSTGVAVRWAQGRRPVTGWRTLMSGSQDWKPKANPWLIALIVTLAAFMEILDTTIVNVALPHIAGALSSSNDQATWTLTSYLVANGIVLPISGFLGNRIGRKRYFLICIGMFGVCSLLCGLAQSLPMLILSRLAQGFFGGGLQPNQQSIILDTFPPEKRGAAFSITAVATIVAPVLGPTLGGWITDNYSWRWIFFINIPFALLTMFGVSATVEDPPWVKSEPKRNIDGIGLGLIALGLGSLQIVMDRGEDADWFGSTFICVMAALAAIGLLGSIAWLLSAKNPIVNLWVMADRNFALGSFTTFMLFAIVYSSAVLIPQLAQEVLNYNSTLAGLVLSPGAVLVCFTIPVVQRVMGFVQTKYIVAFGFVAIGAGLSYSMLLTPNIDYATLAKMRAAQSFGIALLFVPISTLAYATLPKSMNGDAASLYTMFRNVSGSIGISLATAEITERTQVHTQFLGGHLNPFNPNYQQLLQQNAHTLLGMGRAAETTMTVANGMIYQTLRTQAQVLAYSDVFMFCAIGAFCVVPFTFLFSGVKKAGAAPAH